MRIKMKRTERGSRNGLVVETFEAGVEYDIPEDLAAAFRSMGAIDEGDEILHKPTETPETPRRGRPRKTEG